MTIPFEEFAAKSLANPEVKREYDALAPEFECLGGINSSEASKKVKAAGLTPHPQGSPAPFAPAPPRYSPAHPKKTVRCARAANR